MAPPQLPSPGTVSGALFDIDGTLTHSDHLHYVVFKAFLQRHGFNGGEPITEAFFKSEISGRHNPDLFARFFPSKTLQEQSDLADEKEALFRELAASVLVPLSGLPELAHAMAQKGIARCAVTNAPRLNAEMMVAAVGLTAFFGGDARLVIGAECTRAKPHPEPYLEGLRRTGVAAQHAMAFEDSPSGVRAAVAAGIATVGLLTTQSEEVLREAGACCVAQDFRDASIWEAMGLEKPAVFAEHATA